MEKKNDEPRRYFHSKINRWDAATNLLLAEKRQEVLRECSRDKRNYVKRKISFWMEGGKQEAASKVVRISTPPVTTNQQQQRQSTSVSQQISQAERK